MSTAGINYQDLLPGPAVDVNDIAQHNRSHALRDEPTASHALAVADHDEKGLAQLVHGADVKDLGWNEPKEKIAEPLVGGIDNEELWLLVRRFNKQMYHVKETTGPVPGNLDMNLADEDEFSPDKLRSTVERLYMTVIIGLMIFVNHIARLRSWRETRRTSAFCAVYFLAWTFDLIVPLLVSTLIALISYPPSRDILFPSAPLALVDTKTGGLKKPLAGVLGSHDSATGAPENHKGEAIEAEASNFVNGIAHIALSSATGKHPQNEPKDRDSKRAPDPVAAAMHASNARVEAQGGKTEHDMTKVPMETAMWNKMRPIMHTIGDVADGWERFANALSPSPPFPEDTARLRLAGVVIPMLAASLFVTSYMVTKGAMFGIGFGFFGDPVIRRGVVLLNQTFPNWQKLLELRNTLLKGVPTNAQLTITVLRLGEANKAPIPPPPATGHEPPKHHAQLGEDNLSATGGDAPLGASSAELAAAITHDPNEVNQTSGSDIEASKSTQHHEGKRSKILGLFKATARGAVSTALGADKLKAKIGSEHAKAHIGALTDPNDPSNVTGPVDFKARYDTKKGHVYISTNTPIPSVSFTTDHSVDKIGSMDRDDIRSVWSIAIADISEMKKIGGFGWKAKLVVGWALDREIADGLEITDRRGNVWKITAVPLRDELFNRLVAMGGQKWVSW